MATTSNASPIAVHASILKMAQLGESADSVTYGRSRGERGRGIFVIVLFGIPFLLSLGMAIDPLRFGANFQGNRGIGLFGMCVFGAFAGWGISLSGRLQVELFPKSRTYRYTSGSRFTTGTFNDIQALQLLTRSSKGGYPLRWINLTWRNDLRDIPIYFSYDDAQARKELESLSARLGVGTETD